MAIPAALFMKKYTYKKGIILGLALFAIGALLFFPAAQFEIFGFFLVSLYILTFGLAFLETTANPYILSMGDESTATRRLNLAQSFNPVGSLAGMFVASKFILSALNFEKRDKAGELLSSTWNKAEEAMYRTEDLLTIRNPYVLLGLVIIIMLIIIAISKMPKKADHDSSLDFGPTFQRLMKNPKYYFGVISQVFYVGAQILCWTYIIHYAERIGISKTTAQNYNIVAMTIFLLSRFICTFLLKYVNPSTLLKYFAMAGMVTMLGTIFIDGMGGLYCLIATSAFMSLMFPTIYGISLKGLGEDAKLVSDKENAIAEKHITLAKMEKYCLMKIYLDLKQFVPVRKLFV
jgi:FHS family L-fucose permease-like MFS transporter